MALVTPAEFEASVYFEERRDWTETQIAQAISFGESWFYRRTNRDRKGYWFEPKELTVRVHTTGTPVVRCPYPVLSVVSVICDGVDITSEVTNDTSHYIYRNGGTFGTVPDTIDDTVYATLAVTAKFGDPHVLRNAQFQPLEIPFDIKDAVMRLAWHQLKRERILSEQSRDRRGEVKNHYIDAAKDPRIRAVLDDYYVTENSGGFDFR